MSSARVKSFDLTISVEGSAADHKEVGARLFDIASKFVFQKERAAENGFEHWQCRIMVRNRTTLGSFKSQFCPNLWHGRVSATSNEVHCSRSFNYVMKETTRIAGPWKDNEFEPEAPKVMTRQLQTFLSHELRPWQSQIKDIVQQLDDRKITFVYDDVGNSGKSIFSEYLEYHGWAEEIPPFQKLEDLMAAVLALKNKKAFLCDMPRSLPKHKLGEFYAGMESIQNGVAYDKRYHLRRVRFDRPQVVIFANRMPRFHFLSQDRWAIYVMKPDYSLDSLTTQQAVDMQKEKDKAWQNAKEKRKQGKKKREPRSSPSSSSASASHSEPKEPEDRESVTD